MWCSERESPYMASSRAKYGVIRVLAYKVSHFISLSCLEVSR